jgi:hypothetical protein
MHRGPRVSRFAISTVLLLGLSFSNSPFADAGGKQANEIGSMGPVPKAQCVPSDRTGSGLQGQITSEERASRDSELTVPWGGAFSQDGPSYFDHCVSLQTHPGIVVIDVTSIPSVTEDDFRQLVLTIETTPAFLGGLGKFEDHGERGLVRKTSLGAHRADPDLFLSAAERLGCEIETVGSIA